VTGAASGQASKVEEQAHVSLTDILSSAVSGLNAAQAGLRTVSNNIANVATPGYARERVTLSTGVSSGRVNGVVVGEPERVANQFLETLVYVRSGDTGRADVTSDYLDRLQALLGEPGAASGLPARLDAIGDAAVHMTAAQVSPEAVSVFTANVADAIDSLRTLDGDVDGLKSEVDSEIGFTVERINALLERIHGLNDTVSHLDGSGRSSVGAADQRMSAIEELSGLVSVNVREQPNGRVAIDTSSGVALLDGRLRQLSLPTGAGATVSAIDVRFASDDGIPGALTGEKIESSAAGGRLGGLIDLRDRSLPNFSNQVGTLFKGLSETLNAASNAGTSVPAPNRLDGGNSGLVGADRLGFTGIASFAVTNSAGKLVARADIDFSTFPAGATVSDAVNAINAGLGGAATASFADGKLSIQASAASNGVIIAQGSPPSDRAGVGFSQYFGLNDIVRSAQGNLVPPGFASGDPHGFAVGTSADIVLRDASGRSLTRYTMTGSVGPTVGDLVSELNASPLGGYGSFALDSRGRLQFTANGNVTGARIAVGSDSTNRLGTGRSFSSLMGLTSEMSGLGSAEVRPDIAASAFRLPLARLNTGAAIGEVAIGAGDTRGATEFANRLATPVDLGKDGTVTIDRFSALVLGHAGTEASRAQNALADANARKGDAVNRRDSFSGVNIDEELSQMVVLQNSYSAAARVMTTASQMYDTLLAMVD
jgi:flagellar hook-associated protein 1 FlgK